MANWVRLWEDMPTDPKWRVIAKRAGRTIPEVMSIFMFMMTNAGANASERGANASERGVLTNWSDEDVAAALDMEPEHVMAVREAMQGKTLDGDKLSGWEKRQPKREDSSAERAKQWRERKRTQANAHERPDTDADTDIVPNNSNELLGRETPRPPMAAVTSLPVPPEAPDARVYRRGREVLGNSAGGIVKKLIVAKDGNLSLAAAAIETASTKADPKTYLMAIVNARQKDSDIERLRISGDAW